jgi:hypothetical protein
MTAHVIGNPVPTPEELAEMLGMSPDRVAAVRRIMSTPNRQKTSSRSSVPFKAAARKRSSRSGTSARAASKG